MGLKRFQGICEGCKRVYSLESSESNYCLQCKEGLELQKDCIPNMKCKECGRAYYTPNFSTSNPNYPTTKRCPCCTVKGYYGPTHKPRTYDNEKIAKRKMPKGVALQELIRRQEYRRVMDDDGWEHYNKGRKWDRI